MSTYKEDMEEARLSIAFWKNEAITATRLLQSVDSFGYDRGMPIARHIREFLSSASIKRGVENG